MTDGGWLGFLADEQRTTFHGPGALRQVAFQLAEPDGVTSLFLAANLLALALFRSHRKEAAQQLCNQEIDFAVRRSRTAGWPLLAMGALQAQINLVRMETYEPDPAPALHQLALLEPLAAGEPATLPALELDAATVAAMLAAGLPLRELARNVLVADTCKTLHRHGYRDRLLQAAADLTQRFPAASREAGPHHAAEAPWLLDALGQPPIPWPATAGSLGQRRLALVRWCHLAAHQAAAGEPDRAAHLACSLLAEDGLFRGSFASALTPLRWAAALADTLGRAGRSELAGPVLRRVLADPATPGDPTLDRGLRLRLAVPPAPEPDPAPAIDDLLAQTLDRLAS